MVGSRHDCNSCSQHILSVISTILPGKKLHAIVSHLTVVGTHGEKRSLELEATYPVSFHCTSSIHLIRSTSSVRLISWTRITPHPHHITNFWDSRICRVRFSSRLKLIRGLFLCSTATGNESSEASTDDARHGGPTLRSCAHDAANTECPRRAVGPVRCPLRPLYYSAPDQAKSVVVTFEIR